MENVKNMLINLYENDHFSLYLTIALVVLIIIFIIVFIFGKKDKKLEETRRLNKEEIAKAAFKEEKKENKKLEVKEKITKEKLPIDEREPIVTIFEPTNITKEEVIEETNPNEFDMPKPTIKSTKDIEEENAPIKLDEIKEINLGKIDNELENELSELESIKNKFNDIKLPNFDNNINQKKETEENTKQEEIPEAKHYQPSEVFSSVYVPPKKEETDDDFDLPTLKNEEPKIESQDNIKEETKNISFDFNNIKGESYNINDK